MSKSMQVTIDQSGRILIPVKIRTRLGLFPGMTLTIEELNDKEILLQPVSQEPILTDKEGALVVRSQAMDEIVGAEKQERKKRISELVQRTGLSITPRLKAGGLFEN